VCYVALFSLFAATGDDNHYIYFVLLLNILFFLNHESPTNDLAADVNNLPQLHHHKYVFDDYYHHQLSRFCHLHWPNDNLDWTVWTIVMFCEQHVLMCAAWWCGADRDFRDGDYPWENGSYSYDQLVCSACAG
jgi:hypothetical protein